LRLSQRTDDAHTAFRLPKDWLTAIDTMCKELDLTRSQIFRRSIAEFIKSRGYERDIAGQPKRLDEQEVETHRFFLGGSLGTPRE
jgi:hypothetical protein